MSIKLLSLDFRTTLIVCSTSGASGRYIWISEPKCVLSAAGQVHKECISDTYSGRWMDDDVWMGI